MTTWRVGAKRDLPIADTERAWDGAAAQQRIFELEQAQWKGAHLVYDADAPELHGSYKLPFADVVNGDLAVIPAGLRAAASRLPQADVPEEIKDQARAVLDGYFERLEKGRRGEGALEYKSVGMKIDIGGDEGRYEGHFSIFENVDDGNDVMHRGAFAQSLRERGQRVKIFYAHDWDKLIGPVPDELREDEKGLFARGRLSLGTFWGREVWELMKDGALTEGSIGYCSREYGFDDKGIRHLYRVDLYEISPVPLGMNPMTELRAVKAMLVGGGMQALAESVAALQTMVDEIKNGQMLATADTRQRKQIGSEIEGVLEAAAIGSEDLLRRRLRVAELALRL